MSFRVYFSSLTITDMKYIPDGNAEEIDSGKV
jgi:hypothetical protein